MILTQASCHCERHDGAGAGGVLMLGDIVQKADELLSRYAGQVQTIYLDPPMNTGHTCMLHQRCGEAAWRSRGKALSLPVYSDCFEGGDAECLALLETAISLSHQLLREDGSIFLHVDPRLHAKVRLLMDRVFGEKQFVNEIVWTYNTGGRTRNFFGRSHDIILFYQKSRNAYLNLDAVAQPRAQRKNHMRRAVDEKGRTYQARRVNGTEHRYYDDEPVYPGDVWNDVAHLRQKDPQKTGIDGQRPARLLERIILSTSRPGDLVADLFAGSGTTGAAAAALGRRFLMLDQSPLSLSAMRKRLLGHQMEIIAPLCEGAPLVEGRRIQGLGYDQAILDTYLLEDGACSASFTGLDAVDQLSAGFLRDGVFHVFASAMRSRLTPSLPPYLEFPMLSGQGALLTVDVLGRRLLHCFSREENMDGQ